jgi:RimJ/RimL family protein N-acetyltransferase
MTPPLQTDRLVLRPLDLSDAAPIQELFPQWEIVRYLRALVPWPYPPDGALVFCRDVAPPAMERGDQWIWTLRMKTNSTTVIGLIALMKEADDNRGYWLDPRWQRRGLMTEACEAVTEYWFNVLHFPVLRVAKAVANAASRRISERQGMRVVATMEQDYVCGRVPAELWEITADEWNARRPQRGAADER